ncbi:MAG: transcriptional repressor [Bacteroidales bacterium]|nr:transcriptional repressor [Bacteroidales bacterium]
MSIEEIRNKLKSRGLKITPQRIAVFEAVTFLKNHPTADRIAAFISRNYPNVATGTVYKILETLVENKLLMKVKTENDIMRYDAILDNHHHLYSTESERIEDYFDEELDRLVSDYFKKKAIPNFNIQEIRLQIIGKFLNQK